MIVGGIAYTTLPVSEYPQVAPPTVTVTTKYPAPPRRPSPKPLPRRSSRRSTAWRKCCTVQPGDLERQLTITVTFKLGTDLDKAQVLVQNRVAIAQPSLPEEVQRTASSTRKNSPDILMVVFMLSPDDTFDQLYISNYALLQVRDQLLRLDGVGDIQIFGARDYSMRLWLDPDKIATLGHRGRGGGGDPRAKLQIAGGQIASRRSPTAPFLRTSSFHRPSERSETV